MKEIRLRFAPSPTGYLHIGGLRTALYNYLFAKKNNGKFILRIEDTDQTRYVDGAIENLLNALSWAGIDHDEGVFLEDGKIVEKGDFGPYVQSKRLGIYKEYVDRLIEQGDAYYCFCSKERIDAVREEQKVKGMVPKYDGHCRSLSLEEARERIANGEEYVVRQKLPKSKDISFEDLVRGTITFNTDDIDDQVLLKSDGFPTYHMAVVVDDHLMNISHIVRGEEWLSSTPKHVELYEALGWEKPTYVHLPTVLNKERKKLSKRHGDVAVEDFKAQGYLPEGLVNYLALVGWSPEDNEELMNLEELVSKFSFDRVAKTGGIFDRDKLDWVNAHYVREMGQEELLDLAIPYLIEAELVDEKFVGENREWLVYLTKTVQESLHTVKDMVEKVKFAFGDSVEVTEEDALEILKGDQVKELLEAIKEEVSQVEEIDEEYAKGFMKLIQTKTGIKGKNLFMPTRVALTGAAHGPEFVNVLTLLGKDNIISRINFIEDKYL